MNLVKLLFIAIFFISINDCGKHKADPEKKTSAEINVNKFVESSDSSITADQINKMNICNTLLDSLSIYYQDSFKTKDAAQLTRYQEDFVRAQDRICIRAGLSGGYKEYIWIIKNMGNKKNAKLLDSMKLQTY
jgi:hypothetical protein